jgi:hypothetical protein
MAVNMYNINGKMRKLISPAIEAGQKLRKPAVAALAGLMAFGGLLSMDVAGEAGEPRVWNMRESIFLSDPSEVDFYFSQGYDIINITRGTEILRIITREGIQEVAPTRFVLSQAPGFSAPRETHQTNGAVRDAILGFVNENATMRTRDLGTFGNETFCQVMSDDLMGRIRDAALRDPAYAAFGLNETGSRMFHDSTSVSFATTDSTLRGLYSASNRHARIALNRRRNGVIESLPPIEIVHTIIYEVEGRGRGWEMALNNLVSDFIVGETRRQVSIARDPVLEHAIGNASGGIHNVFMAADNGEDVFRVFVNQNISGANPHFTFTYDQFQMARATCFSLRGADGAANRDSVIQAGFSNQDAAIEEGNRLQDNLYDALDMNRTPEQRRLAALEVNRLVSRFAEIGNRAGLSQLRSVDDVRRAIIDLNNLDRGVHWQGIHTVASQGQGITTPAPATPAPTPAPATPAPSPTAAPTAQPTQTPFIPLATPQPTQTPFIPLATPQPVQPYVPSLVTPEPYSPQETPQPNYSPVPTPHYPQSTPEPYNFSTPEPYIPQLTPQPEGPTYNPAQPPEAASEPQPPNGGGRFRHLVMGVGAAAAAAVLAAGFVIVKKRGGNR